MGFRWGCVADDFTGASDLASFLVNKGVRTLLVCGKPPEDLEIGPDVQAIVVALKTRTAPVAEAVKESMDMYAWLKEQGCLKFYYKYCSTFDSTAQGNIGPVADAVLDWLDQTHTILCPALLVNGRVVRDGKLYVNGKLLEESGMRNHPLTPMLHSALKVLMEQQSKYPCMNLTWEDYAKGPAHVEDTLAAFAKDHPRFYVSVDYCAPEHGKLIMDYFGELPFLTGGSGIMEPLAEAYWGDLLSTGSLPEYPFPEGRRFMVAGSCSDMTRAQIQSYLAGGGFAVKVNPQNLVTGEQTEEEIWEEIRANGDKDVLVFSAGALDNAKGRSNLYGGQDAAARLEQLLSNLAGRARDAGCKKIIAAGGETSGAVVNGLGLKEFHVAESVDPGVPVLIPMQNTGMRMVLKSGNFGSEDFFRKVLNNQ